MINSAQAFQRNLTPTARHKIKSDQIWESRIEELIKNSAEKLHQNGLMY